MTKLASAEDILDYWLGGAVDDALQADEKNKLWFTKSFATDSEIAGRFLDTLAALAGPLAGIWAKKGIKSRIAAIIALDQFSRNLFRGHPLSFFHDKTARQLSLEAVQSGQDRGLSEVERIFLYLPFEHAEDLDMQDISVDLFTRLAKEASEDFKPLCESTLDYAHRHKDVIVRFCRFQHRNGILKRPNTAEEIAYLRQPGAGF